MAWRGTAQTDEKMKLRETQQHNRNGGGADRQSWDRSGGGGGKSNEGGMWIS